MEVCETNVNQNTVIFLDFVISVVFFSFEKLKFVTVSFLCSLSYLVLVCN
jgi:hypothetical protein